MKYFHEASDEEISALVEAKATIKDVNQKYIQPDWCDYPGALDGANGMLVADGFIRIETQHRS